eukprot:TRINITY_DN10369_c0_g1_i1.p2 TRINITY_DN10369_c0_g1~~TRINITY_DN10369_c0_g1_i1.p2  ORF type:complete len:318 (+),score=30.70 TRINITY_DN10369_c0_g1_i1:123-1076(+)
MIRRPPRSTQGVSSAASDVYKRQYQRRVHGGQQVTFDATGIDPDGTAVTIKYEATGGNFNGNVWTAPNESGYYQVIAYAVDTNGLKSDPAIITIRVEKPEGAGNVRLSAIPKVKLGTATAKRPITIDEGDTFGDTYSLILSTRTQDDNHTATIEITFTDTNANHNFTYAADKGMVTPISEEDLGGNEYRWTFEYTAPTAATVGDDWNVPVTITIYSKDDVSDKDTITLPFIVNTPPTITNIQFAEDSGASAQVVGLNDTVTLDVAVTDKNQTQGDTITCIQCNTRRCYAQSYIDNSWLDRLYCTDYKTKSICKCTGY